MGLFFGERELQTMNKINVLLGLILMVSALVLSGCGGDEPAEPESQASGQSSAPERERTIRRSEPAPEPASFDRREDPAKRIPKVAGQVDYEGYGLTLMVDGSSPEAFAESLELIASDSNSEQYRQLDSAIRYLQVYSSDGWSGLPGFYERLNGMTGEEIIERAQRLRADRAR